MSAGASGATYFQLANLVRHYFNGALRAFQYPCGTRAFPLLLQPAIAEQAEEQAAKNAKKSGLVRVEPTRATRLASINPSRSSRTACELPVSALVQIVTVCKLGQEPI